MAQAEAKFLTGGLMRHVVVMSFSASVGLMAVFLVDFIDMIFISMLGHAELAAAVGYAGAILFFTTSISVGLAITGGALVARSLGAGLTEQAREQTSNVLAFGMLIAVGIAFLLSLNLDALITLVGAQGQTRDLGVAYLAIIVPAMPLLMMGMIASAVLRAYGDARRSMMVTIAGAVVNAVLDPIFIFGLNMGLEGAAWASVVSRFTIMMFGIVPLVKIYGGIPPLRLPAFLRDIGPILGIAVPAVLANVATPVGVAYVTRAMAEFGEAAVAGMAIVGRLTPVAFAMIFALSGAVGPIIGQNYGAENFTRVRRAFADSLLVVGLYVVFAAVVLFLLRGAIADLFNATGVTRELVYLFCGPLALAWFFNGVVFVGNAAFNNLSHPFYSTGINWGRNTLGIIPPVYIGGYFWGAPGVLIGQAVGGVVFAALSWILVQKVMHKQEFADQADSVPVAQRRIARMMQLFNLRR